MKTFCLLFLLMFSQIKFGQNKPKPKQPLPTEMQKQLAAAMKDMSPEEQAEMNKIMKGILPTLNSNSGGMASYPEFATNKELIPKKGAIKLASIATKKLAQADIANYAGNLYNKIVTRGEAAEVTLIKSITSKISKASDLTNAAALAMMQGHPQAAMALSMKAVQSDPANVNAQNNMAALLTQYGYPLQAIPVLEKLKTQFPYNSTVLNNLGQAWFSLGDLDSAKKFLTLAYRINPYHPDVKVCSGLIEEITGDPIKAEKTFIEAVENAPNHVIEKILINKTGENGIGKIDFEKLKRSITIYEYFPKDWILIPELSDNVSGFENDRRIQNGYNTMFTELSEKIELATEAANQEANALSNKGEEVFVTEMAKASMQGINKMSLTAVTVQKILAMFMATWMQENIEEYRKITDNISAKRTDMNKSGANDKCPDFDRKNNEFLAYANPLIRKYHTEKIEIFRNWLNAFCTWIWYITGNPINTVMAMCIGWTGGLENLYESAINDQLAIAKSCVNQNGEGSSFVATPEIPNFSCPTLIKIPLGNDWQELGNAVKNFDANSLGIKSNSAHAVPNHTQAFGGDQNSIAQPGIAPFVQSANGSVSPGMINSSDDDLTPLSKIPLDDLTPLSKIPLDELTPLSEIPLEDLTPLPDLRKSKFLKDLLNKMMRADCKNVKSPKDQLKEQLEKMMKSVKELEAFEDLKNELKEMMDAAEEMEAIAEKKEAVKNEIKKMMEETEKMEKYESMEESKKIIDKTLKEMEAMDEMAAFKNHQQKIMDLVNQMEATPSIVNDVRQNGLQPSINSSVQVPGTITPQPGLFQ